MDWRNRNYYLVKISSEARQMRDKILKGVSDSVEFHSPYGHFLCGEHDGRYACITGIPVPCYMLSCNKRDSEIIEYELRKAERNDVYSRFFKLTREITGQ